MRKIVSIKFGSHLYGTATPASDLDFKSVYIPDARSILLQRVKGSVSNKRPKIVGEKNYAGEVDEESFSLQRFLGLAAEGQTLALDVLFAPEQSMTSDPEHEWLEIIDNRSRLITKKSAAFVGYCRQQANKYGVKGSRVAAARAALSLMDGIIDVVGPSKKLGDYGDQLRELCDKIEHTAIVQLQQGSGAMLDHWEVCGRKIQFTSKLGVAREVVQRLVDEYGQRALQAESNQGIDWKALSHAVRVGTQAIELLNTSHVTFPLPNAEHVLDIKLGRLPYQEVAGEIERLLEEVESAAAASRLPEQPDMQWIDDFVARIYGYEVRSLPTIAIEPNDHETRPDSGRRGGWVGAGPETQKAPAAEATRA